jgi:HEAT repeat protein
VRPFLTLLLSAAACFAESAEEAKAAADAAKLKVDELKAALKGKDEDLKLSAISGCADSPHPLTAAALSPILVDPSEDLRIAAAKALGRMKSLPEAAKALHSGIKPNEEKEKVITEVFTAIGEVNHPSSIAVLKDWISHRMTKRDTSDSREINAAIEAMGSLKWKSCVTALIDLGKKNIVANGWRGGNGMRWRQDVRYSRALQRLTGESFEDIDGWDDWWKKNAGKFNEDLTAK